MTNLVAKFPLRLLLMFCGSTLAVNLANPVPGRAQVPASDSRHVSLGFTGTFPLSQALDCLEDCIEDPIGNDLIGYYFGVGGAARFKFDLGADVTMSWDRAEILPGATLPVRFTYAPANDPGPELSFDAGGTLTVTFDVTALGYAELCTVFPPICPFLVGLDSIDSQLHDFTFLGGSRDFVAPLAPADGNVVVPASGDTATVLLLGEPMLEVSLQGNLTLSPDPPAPGAPFPGLAGAAGVLKVQGVTLTGIANPVNPSIAFSNTGALEWDAAGATSTASLVLPGAAGAPFTFEIVPIFHWLGTSASISLKLHFVGPLGLFSDPGAINIFAGSLGPFYTDPAVALDQQIRASISPLIEPIIGPLISAEIAAGNVPVPLTDPVLATLPPAPPAGRITFMIDPDPDGDTLFDGTEIAIGSNPDDPDTDDDLLDDGEEVANGCNPLVVDTDGDGLTDYQEVKVYFTLCNNPDTDGDQLNDGLEVTYGTNPLDSDSDDDGVPDGDDVEWLQAAISGLSGAAFKDSGKGPGLRTAMLSILDAVEGLVAKGDTAKAVAHLESLRKRIDGCASPSGVADGDDWIVDCAAQVAIRALVDLYISNLST